MSKGIMLCLLMFLAAGCDSARTSTTPPAPQAPYPNGLLRDPPVQAECELMPLPNYAAARRYLSYDLNGDGSPEYFIENCTGAHSMGFALVDAAGELLTSPDSVGEIGGDRMLILSASHHGYHDIICSDREPGGVSSRRWQYDGHRYVQVDSSRFKGEDWEEAFIETEQGTAIFCWYFDIFARPPGRRLELP